MARERELSYKMKVQNDEKRVTAHFSHFFPYFAPGVFICASPSGYRTCFLVLDDEIIICSSNANTRRALDGPRDEEIPIKFFSLCFYGSTTWKIEFSRLFHLQQ